MSGVLQPVGPEPAAIYWLRRALVLGVLALIAVVATAVVSPGTSKQQAVPAAATLTPVADATPLTSGSASGPAAGSGNGSAPTTGRPAPTPAASNTASGAASSRARTTGAGATSEPATSSTQRPTATPSCAAGQLRTTLTGQDHLQPQQPTSLDVSVINGSAQACMVTITERNFEVTIHSGRDRIWSTRDCSSAVRSQRHKLTPQQSTAWSLKWNGRRSAAGCKSRLEIPRAGTYVATAHLSGTKPVRLWMVLHG